MFLFSIPVVLWHKIADMKSIDVLKNQRDEAHESE